MQTTMNESASKASLASSQKPSTAISSSSPTGRKTRTIIVARTINEEPATVAPATHSDVVNQHHSRDAKSGKLASYAALGGAQDVERFGQFLAEQRGQPSASELRAATSPLASMKRKTMSRIQLEGVDLKSEEKEKDAHKRREQAGAHRKWLNALPIHERVSQQRQQNALWKWRQMNRDWENFKVRAARRLGKAPQELVMSRAAAYREQREMYDALQKARPLSDKVGEDIWLVSLRNEGTRYVPVGNIFSGLFCPIRESTKIGPRVRRPLDYFYNQENREHETSRPISKLEKRSLTLLERKKWRLRKQLKVIQPHEVDRSASSHLAVATTDLFAWASGETEEAKVVEDAGSVQSYSEVEVSRRRRLRSYASPKNKAEGISYPDQFIGPSLRIAHDSDDEESELSPESHEVNPSACSPLRLSFYTPVNEQDQRSLSISNDGNTIVHYQWWRAPFQDENAELTYHLRGRRTRKEEQEMEQTTTTSVSKLGGTLLPGETQHFVFTFRSSKAGMFLEKWFLDADPRPRIYYGLTPLDSNLPVEVRLICVAEDNFSAWKRREKQLTRVEQRESHFFVANLVDEILETVRPPEPVEFNTLTARDDVDRFYEQNGAKEFSDVYFSPELVRDCNALYERAQGVLKTLTPVLPVEEGKENVGDSGVEGVENPSKETLENGSIEGTADDLQLQSAQDASLPDHVVEVWNWRLETLRELCKMADEAQNKEIHRLTQQLKKETEEVEEEEDNEEEEDEPEESEDEESDSENDESIVEKPPHLSPREVRRNERLARRQALEDEISALTPDLQETFDMLRFAAHTAPYTSARLEERLHERLASLCGELPVVCEIAETMKTLNNVPVSGVQAAKVGGVGKLIIRAIDEAIGGDQDHQNLFEQQRRRLQNMWLSDKASYISISRWIDKAAASTSVSLAADTAPNPERLDRSGVVLMQVDLDLAAWFSLVKAEAKENAVEGASSVELAWRFSPDLVQHSSFVPVKVADAAEALEKVLNALSSGQSSVHTVVLVSELSRPPLTKQMHKLLRTAAQAELRTKALATGETEENKPTESDEDATMKTILERLSSQLSLRNVAQVMQRAVHKDVVFCCAVEDVQTQIDLSRKELLLNATVEASGDAVDPGIPPRIVLLEHLDAAGVDLITHASRKRELAASKPVTPAPEAQKPVGGKKTSATAPKRKPSTATAVPIPPANMLSVRDLAKLELSGKQLSEKGVVALRDQFVRMAGACVMDGIPSLASESVFDFTAKVEDTAMIAGPTLTDELEIWSRMLQPTAPSGNETRVLTAVVGGKCLEAKLRLIDGLLEIVQEIYFVGEVAMSLYRVLHTKASTSTTLNVEVKREEEDAELEDDAQVSKEETEVNEVTSGKDAGDVYKGLWDLLGPAVQKLQQKASRKCVRLLLPIDWIVGETPLEEQDLTAAVDDSDEEEEEDDEGEGSRKKRKKSQMKSARLKPLLDADHVDVFELKRQHAYEGERAHVVLIQKSAAGWRAFEDVTAQCLSNARVTEGKASVLASFYPDSEGDEADEEADDAARRKAPPKFKYDWTFRALDVGPIAMEALAKALETQESASDASTQSRALVINGVCGAVEFNEFAVATRQLLRIVQDYSSKQVFIAGSTTATWLRQLEQLDHMATGREKDGAGTDSNVNSGAPVRAHKVVGDRAMRNARVLKQLIAAKPHAILANLVSSDSM